MKTEKKLKRRIGHLKKYIFKLEQHTRALVKAIQELKKLIEESQDGKPENQETIHNTEQGDAETGR